MTLGALVGTLVGALVRRVSGLLNERARGRAVWRSTWASKNHIRAVVRLDDTRIMALRRSAYAAAPAA